MVSIYEHFPIRRIAMKNLFLLCLAAWLLSALPVFSAGKTEEGAAKAPVKPVTVVFRTQEHGEGAVGERKVIEEFNASQTGVKVELIQGQWTQYYAQLRLSVMAGDPPQLGISMFSLLPAMYEYYTPLDKSPVGNILDMANLKASEFDERGWQESQYNGVQYVIPLNYPSKLMWYNKDIFRKAGLDPEKFPETMSEFVVACNKIKQAGFYAFHPASDGPVRFWRRAWETFYIQQGGEIVDKGFTKATFNNEKGVKALQFLVDIVQKHGWNVVGADGYKQFGAKELGIIYAGNWFYANAVKSGADFSGAMTPVWFDKRATWVGGQGLQIPKQPAGTPKETYLAALEVIKFYLKNSHVSTMIAGHAPAYKQIMDKKEMVESEYWKKAGSKLAKMVSDGAVFYQLKHAKASELESAIETKIDLAVAGKMSVQEALRLAEEECNQILKK
jgi:multiple sugar transport system substrate-binding protein